MSWTDRASIENILKLKQDFKIKVFVETGCYKGVNAELHSHFFDAVYTCDINPGYVQVARDRLASCPNVFIKQMPSSDMIKSLRDMPMLLFYLDAHFYNPSGARWVVVEELKALAGKKDCVIIIHDFDNGELGHLCYDGEHLGWNVVGEHLIKVNPSFHYYTNTRDFCDIVDEEKIKSIPIKTTDDVLDTLRFVNSSDEKRYRGILYCVPRELDLRDYSLVKYG